jgi:hypothetical protein
MTSAQAVLSGPPGAALVAIGQLIERCTISGLRLDMGSWCRESSVIDREKLLGIAPTSRLKAASPEESSS